MASDRRDDLPLLDHDQSRCERRLEWAQDMAGLGWWEFNPDTGAITASIQARAIYGIAADAPLTVAMVQKIVVKDDRPMLDRALRDLVTNGKPYDVHYSIERPLDGRIADIHSVATWDPETRLVYGIFQDFSQQRRAEHALRESEARLRATFDSVTDHIFIMDRDGRYTHANNACLQFFDRRLEDVQGATNDDLFPPDDAADSDRVNCGVFAGEPNRRVIVRRRQNGTCLLETIKVPIYGEGREVVGLCGVSRDITEVHNLEEQLRQAQKMEAVGRLAGGVAHDFNNLLTPILGFAELLVETFEADDPRYGDLRTIMSAAEQARDLTAQLLAFGRKQILDMRRLDLNEIIDESVPMLRRLLRENVHLGLKLGADVGVIRADASQLENVLINLVVNAADAMPDGGTLQIETMNADLEEGNVEQHPGCAPGRYVLMAVSDDGIGMDSETMSMIFEPFFTTKGLTEGTGLGLATVHGIVKQHQGSVWVYSEPDRGSVFKVYLPRVDAPVEAAEPVPDRGDLRGSARVLVVEDDEAVRNLAEAVLSKYGYDVVVASSPEKAVDLVTGGEARCDLLLTDVVMPGMNGVQLHRALASMWPDVPVLFMSGYTRNVIARHGILAEGLRFIQKPFTPRDLAQKIRDILVVD